MSIRSSLWTGRIPSLIESLGADLIEEPRINRQGVMFRETKEYSRHHFCQKTHGVQRSFHCGLARYLQIFPAKVCFNLQHVFPAIVLKLFHLSLSFDAFPESHRSFEYPYGSAQIQCLERDSWVLAVPPPLNLKTDGDDMLAWLEISIFGVVCFSDVSTPNDCSASSTISRIEADRSGSTLVMELLMLSPISKMSHLELIVSCQDVYKFRRCCGPSSNKWR